MTDVFRNPSAAEELWGRDDKGQTWELMFALDELRDFAIPYAELNGVVGYQANNVIQGFTVLDESKSAALFDYLSLDSEKYLLDPTPDEFTEAIKATPSGPTDLLALTKRRTEQDYLRRELLRRTGPICALCQQAYPPQFLVAAHIKKRAVCTNEERMDFVAVAMLACKFGCDALFEEGYLAVSDAGVIELSDYAPTVGAAHTYLADLAGRTCPAWVPASAKDFEWHRGHTFTQAATANLPLVAATAIDGPG